MVIRLWISGESFEFEGVEEVVFVQKTTLEVKNCDGNVVISEKKEDE